MNYIVSFFIIFLLCTFTACHKCPSRGQVRFADRESDRRFLQCDDGRGRWYVCSEGWVFVEQKQNCVSQTRLQSGSSQSSSGNTNSNRGYSNRDVNSNSNSQSRSNGGVAWDYHW